MVLIKFTQGKSIKLENSKHFSLVCNTDYKNYLITLDVAGIKLCPF